MKYFIWIASIILIQAMEIYGQQNFYDFTVEAIDGEPFSLERLKGKKVLVVNTASKCGFTPQYEGLEQLYREYADEGLVILGFPSNDFAEQEPGTNEEIALFCSTRFNVTFPMMAKIKVKGEDKHPLYRWLTDASLNGVEDSKVSWNFQKYMIDENGRLVGHVPPKKKPDSKEILGWLEGK